MAEQWQGTFRHGPNTNKPHQHTLGVGGMNFYEKGDDWTWGERGMLRHSRLIGVPAGVETYRAAMDAGETTGRATMMGIGAAGRQMAQPLYWGLMETVGVMPNAYFAEAVPGFSWMGFGFEQEAAIVESVKRGKSPFKMTGHALFTSRGEKFLGMKGVGKRALPVLGSIVSLADAVHWTHKGWSEGGVVGAGKGFLKAAAFNVGINLGLRAIGSYPALALLATTGAAAYHVASEVSRDLKTYNNRSLPLMTGDMSAFKTQSAASMRQRSLQAIQRSHLNARSVLGNEAAYQHVSSIRGM